MFENFLIRPDSLRNEERDGEVIGFCLAVRNANYRGVFLSLHNGYYLSVDGEEFPVSAQSFEINGKPPRSFDEIRTAVWEHWDYDDEGILHVGKPAACRPVSTSYACSSPCSPPTAISPPTRSGYATRRSPARERALTRPRTSSHTR